MFMCCFSYNEGYKMGWCCVVFMWEYGLYLRLFLFCFGVLYDFLICVYVRFFGLCFKMGRIGC